MEIGIYFLGAALFIAIMFLLLDTKQSKRMNMMMRDTKNLEPLFLLRATEQKLSDLNRLLYNATIPVNSRANHSKSGYSHQILSAQLTTLVDGRRNGTITLKAYYGELNELWKKAREVK